MAEHLGGGLVRVVVDGRAARAWAVAADDGATWVYLDGQVHRVRRLQTPDADGAAAPLRRDTDALAAPMPASVTAVHVTPGAVVDAGDLLITLEAMKMELQVRAPRRGTVTRVGCLVGDLVQAGVPLVELT